MFILGTFLNCWGTSPSRHRGPEKLEKAEKKNDFEGLVRKYYSRSLADKSQWGTLEIYIFLIRAGVLTSSLPSSGSGAYQLGI